MRARIITITVLMAASIVTNVYGAGILTEEKVFEPVSDPSVEALVGERYKTYSSVSTGTEVSIFKFKGIRIRYGGEEFSGSWLIDKKTGKISVHRFDSSSQVYIALYTVDGVEGYLVAIEKEDLNGNVARDILMPVNGNAAGIMVSKFQKEIY